ncbi:hypothetical protein GXW83_16675 [Streptacidiphilus sp. PB12-B1b]|nr:hypothetical protein GXW83_16675 [Streptacidiphilus sp. PB12-B1b]
MLAENDHHTDGAVRQWHMTADGASVALCGRELEPGAARLSTDAWGHTEEKFCHTCGALYLRQVP